MLRMNSGMWRLRAYSMISSVMTPPTTRSLGVPHAGALLPSDM